MIIASRYEVIEEIGSGLWANVYKVKDIRTNQVHALKFFQRLDSKSLYEKFRAEQMHHITKIEHPNLLRITDFGNFGDHIFYLSEYFQGRTLRNFRFNPANIELFFDILVQICYGLSALHSQQIIHKDLKPENVLFRFNGKKLDLRVTDYGFMKIDLAVNQQKISQSLPYVAPEIYLGKGALPQSDFYSLGAILYRMITGVLPYTIKQITNFMAGDKKNLMPKFLREINPSISAGLETMILKMLENNPADRFQDAESIISYINKIQLKKYPFSRKWSIVNNIRFSDYLVRENYSHRLKDFMPIIESKSGKVVILSAGKGLGKNNALTLFRYHILRDKYNVFDYECGVQRRDPFFALIKEFYHSVERNDKLISDLSKISEKLKKYLFDSEKIARMIVETEETLQLDFKTTSNFIIHLSEEKPLVFILRAAQYLKKETIDFINYLSDKIVNKRVLIILSTNDPSKTERIIHPVVIKIDALTLNQTREYVSRLLKTDAPETFIEKLWIRSYGNPMFIEQILIDLTSKRKICNVNKLEFNFDYDLNDYDIPDTIKHSIYEKMSHLSKERYLNFQHLSLLHTPLSKKLIKHVLEISDEELFYLLKEGLNNELLRQMDNYYYFTFREAKDRFVSECSQKEMELISNRVKTFFIQKDFTSITILKGVISHMEMLKDYNSVRLFKLKLIHLYTDLYQFENAFLATCEIVELNFTGKIKLSLAEIKKDLQLLLDKSEWATNRIIPSPLKKHITKMPEMAEKYVIIGNFFLVMEKLKYAQEKFEHALEICYTGKMRILVLQSLARVYYAQNLTNNFHDCVNELEKHKLTDFYEITFIELKALLMYKHEQISEAINLIEDFIPTIQTQNNPNFFIKIASLHNVLGFLYHKQRLLDESIKNFFVAQKIWEKNKYQRKLVTVYNNIGDVALIQGDTKTALLNFRHAIKICSKIDCKTGGVLSLLNHAQAYIKLGQFDNAELFLSQAKEKSEHIVNKPFYDSIIDNIAIARSKINHFFYYLKFLQENVPGLLDETIYKITPLTKTYFYFLNQIGNYEKIERLLNKVESIIDDFRAHEFYYQMWGFLYIHKGNFDKAFENIDLAFKYSQQNSSNYAQVINCIRFTECYLGLGDLEKAEKMYQKANSLSQKFDFRYWKMQLGVMDIKLKLLRPDVSFRRIIRESINLLSEIKKCSYFIQEIELLGVLVQIYTTLHINAKATEYFKKYKDKIEKAIIGLNENDQQLFYLKTGYFTQDYHALSMIKIVPRETMHADHWQEELYNIIKIKDNHRIRFFIQKSINQLFSPYYFCIIFKHEWKENKTPFIRQNITAEEIYSKVYKKNIETAVETNKVLSRRIDKKHVLFIPLRVQATVVGCMIMSDQGEMKFTRSELSVVRIVRFHLTSILLRINEFRELNSEMKMLNNLIEISQKFFTMWGLEKLEQEVVAYTLDFVGGSRGFLIKKDESQNYQYKVAMDDTKNIVTHYVFVNKVILSEVQNNNHSVYIENARKAGFFSGYSDYDFDTLSIYCSPIIVDGEIYGFLYIDNFNEPNKQLMMNKEFLRLLLTQIGLSIKNTIQYELLREKSKELQSLNNLKNDFTSIVSHELKTPVTNLKNYSNRLKKIELDKKDNKIADEIETNVNRLQNSINDILNYNKYKIVKKVVTNVSSIDDVIHVAVQDIENRSSLRHMRFKIDIERNLPQVKINWDAFYLMLKNILLNSVRFTKDFGTIVSGARLSAFEQEEIDGKESLIVYIQDNGIGIPAKEIKNIFHQFYEVGSIYSHSSGTVEFRSSGLGLGLATAKMIVSLHHGKIWVNSKEGEGTTVFIAIPIAEKVD